LPEREERIEMNDRPHPSLLPQEKEERPPRLGGADVGWFVAALACLMLFSSAAFADDVITNIMSPIASYQYPEDFSAESLTNGGVISPIVSYQYLEWPGDGILNLQSSPVASYYYQFLDAPVLIIISTTRTPATAESTPAYLISPAPASQLMAFHGGIFTANLASIDPNQMTIVLTHGWTPINPLTGAPLSTPDGVDSWPTGMAAQLRASGITTANIVAWNWVDASKAVLPGTAAAQTPGQGIQLGQALLNTLGPSYSHPIHFVGHSLGTLVNAYAANFLQGANFAGEPVSPTPWPTANMHMTLLDEAEVAEDFAHLQQSIDTLRGLNGNPFAPDKPSYYHPLPKQFRWADNYVSAFGLLQPGAANVILTNGFPAAAPNPETWLFHKLPDFHDYPKPWYEETIQNDGASVMGFRWSFEEGGWFSQAPGAGSVYVQAFNSSHWDLTLTNWNYGTNLLDERFAEYKSAIANSANNEVPGLVTANGSVNGQIVGALAGFDAFILSFFTSPNNSAPQFRAWPLDKQPLGGSVTNVPAYAWMQMFVPTNAISMSFNYVIQGDWQSDSLAVALNGTNVLFLPGSEIETNVVFSSGPMDVSAFAGQTNEFFVGIVGGTSTNAQLTVENLTFSVPLPPTLQAQMSGGLVLSWPMSAQNFSLQTTTNLAAPNSWTTLTNLPAIVNLQNAVTNPVSGGAQFYRLKQ
jgi:hypothetical protein